MKTVLPVVAIIAAGVLANASAGTLNLAGSNPDKVDAGFFPCGTRLSVSAKGTVMLCWEYLCRPDGSLAAPVSPQDAARIHATTGAENYPKNCGGDGVNYFEGGGLNFVPGHGDIGWPIAGKQTTDTKNPAAIRFGAVIGTFNEFPTREDWFCVGFERNIVVPSGGAHLYLLVNDSWYADNAGGFQVTIEKDQPARTGSLSSKASVAPTPALFATSTQVNPLPSVNAFGHALPPGIGLTHQIEASPDLVNWSSATNVIFYFKDLDSPKFSSRFYRFLGTQ